MAKPASGQTRFSFPAYFALFFGLVGFTVAQTLYDLILGTPEFLVARQNTGLDLWLLVGWTALAMPLVFAGLCYLAGLLSRILERSLALALTWGLSALFCAQLTRQAPLESTLLFLGIAILAGALVAWLLLFTRLRVLGQALALLAIVFHALFLLRAPGFSAGEGVYPQFAGSDAPATGGPPIVFVLADELALSSILTLDGEIDAVNFPNLYRFQQDSTWFSDTTTVADGTLEAVAAILTGRIPRLEALPATIASYPANLFTLLPGDYRFNVVESATRFCPETRCTGRVTSTGRRFVSLLLDLTALYLHRVVPPAWISYLPPVSDNWSGFFAARQDFFPGGWVAFAEGQALVDRPDRLRDFIGEIEGTTQLSFIHILFPHVPYLYLPDGRNYGNHWVRGLSSEVWGPSQWSVTHGRQRQFVQIQYFDRLLGELFDHLEAQGLYDDALVILVADHGVTFRPNDYRRILSETNEPDILRIPLLIKYPGQRENRLITQPVNTLDILPTILGVLGLDTGSLALDGIDLAAESPEPARQRPAISFRKREFRHFDPVDLGIAGLVADNRRELALDDPDRAVWNIGPLSDFHGKPLTGLCETVTGKTRFHPSEPNMLSYDNESNYIPALVTGILLNDLPETDPVTFAVAQEGRIVASGETTLLNGRHHLSALIKPEIAERPDWSPELWVVDSGQCWHAPRK